MAWPVVGCPSRAVPRSDVIAILKTDVYEIRTLPSPRVRLRSDRRAREPGRLAFDALSEAIVFSFAAAQAAPRDAMDAMLLLLSPACRSLAEIAASNTRPEAKSASTDPF